MNTDRMIFCFGSNEAGIHGAGAALYAFKNKGAKWGKGYGPSGYSFALPTKDIHIRTRKLDDVIESIRAFVGATQMSALEPDYDEKNWFYVTPVGTGLAGFDHADIAPHFTGACNCRFPDIWEPYLGKIPGIFPEYQDNFIEKYGYDETDYHFP